MHKFSILLTLASLLFFHGFISVHARTSASGTINRVPMDSVIVLSVDGQEIISKSGILKNKQWKTLLNRIEESGSPVRKWFADSNHSGIAWEEPLQFFVRLVEGERP